MRKSNSWQIAKACDNDFDELTLLWEKSVKATHDFLAENDFLELKRQMPVVFLPQTPEIWLCRDNGKIAGFIGCNGHYVEMLFVHPQWFGCGIGTCLLRYAARLYGKLCVTVNEQNRQALEFYLRRNFEIAGWASHDNQGLPYALFYLEMD